MSDYASPLVSILMPCYNHEPYIETAIKSALNQSYKNFEIILIDDGSTDNTWQILLNYIGDPRVKANTRNNLGLIATLKELRSKARGKYLTILASDDKFYPNKLEKMVPILESNSDAVLCVGKTDIIDINDNKLGVMQGEYRGKGSLYTKLLQGEVYISSVSTLVKTDAYSTVEFFDPYIEDLPAWLQISKIGRVICIPDIVASYRFSPNSMSKNAKKMVKAEMNIIAQFLSTDTTPNEGLWPAGWCARWFKAYSKISFYDALVLCFSKRWNLKAVLKIDFIKGLIYIFYGLLARAFGVKF